MFPTYKVAQFNHQKAIENCRKCLSYVIIKGKSIFDLAYKNIIESYVYFQQHIYPVLQNWARVLHHKYETLCTQYLNIKPVYVTAGITGFILLGMFIKIRSKSLTAHRHRHRKSSDYDDLFPESQESSTAANNPKSDQSLFSQNKQMEPILQVSREEQQDEQQKKHDRIFFQMFQNYRETLNIDFQISKNNFK